MAVLENVFHTAKSHNARDLDESEPSTDDSGKENQAIASTAATSEADTSMNISTATSHSVTTVTSSTTPEGDYFNVLVMRNHYYFCFAVPCGKYAVDEPACTVQKSQGLYLII